MLVQSNAELILSGKNSFANTVTAPAEIREKLKLYLGDKITYEDTTAGIHLKPASKDMIDDFGLLKARKHSEDLEEIRNSVRKKMVGKILR